MTGNGTSVKLKPFSSRMRAAFIVSGILFPFSFGVIRIFSTERFAAAVDPNGLTRDMGSLLACQKADPSGVVDQNIDLSEFFDRVADHAVHFALVAYIAAINKNAYIEGFGFAFDRQKLFIIGYPKE